MIHKKFASSLILLLILVISISAVSAYEGDNSTVSIADENAEILNKDIGDEYLEVCVQDEDVLEYDGHSSDDSLMKLNEDESAIAESGSGTVDSMYLFDDGVVSGAADVIAVNPWVESGSLEYVIPDGVTDIKSAIVIINSYSGSGNSDTYALHSDVSLTTDSTVVLGSEDLDYSGNQVNDPVVYVINDHTTKQYSDYQYVYNITNMIADLSVGDSLRIDVANSRLGSKSFDGRIKMIALFIAYDDGDNDKINYWLDVGQVWTNAMGSTSIPTSSYDGATDNLTLETVALSSYYAIAYKINGDIVSESPTEIYKGSYFINAYWDSENHGLSDYFYTGQDTSFDFGADSQGWGSYKTNILLLTATEKGTTELPGAEVKVSSEYTSVPSVYAGVVNNLTVKVTNSGSGVSDVVVSVYIGDELVGSQTIADYVAGETYTLNIVDSTIRPVTENTVNGNDNERVVYTVVVSDADGVINSTDFSFVVVYNGNLGKDYAYLGANPTLREFSVVGDVIVLTTDGYSAGSATSRVDSFDVALNGGSVSEALLYVPYNWDKVVSGDFNSWNTTFNGNVIAPIASYRDQGNLGNYGKYGYGLVVYNVTSFVADGANTFEFNKTSGNVAVYPSSLIVLVDNPSSSVVNTVYIWEEADLLSKSYNKNLDASFTSSFSTVSGDAALYVFAASAQAGEGNLIINGVEQTDVWSGVSNGVEVYNASVDAGDISVKFVSTGATILGLQQIVVVKNTIEATNLDADDLVMTYKNGTWAVTLTDSEGNAISNAVVKVGLNINGVDKVYDRVTDVNGVASLTINLVPGTYAVNATFEGDDTYKGSFANATVTVNKAVPVLTAEDLTMSYKDGSGWSVSLTGIDGATISGVGVKIGVAVGNGVVYTRATDANGVASLPINLNPGTYAVNATFAGNNYYESAFINATVTVNKSAVNISAADVTMGYKDGSKYNVTVVDADGAALAGVVVKFTIGNSNYNIKTDSNGVASLPINLNIGNYTVSATVNDAKYESATISNAVSVQNNIKISASDINMTYQDGTAYEVQLVNENGDPVALAGQVVKITVKGKTYDRKTDANGVASLPINLAAGGYVLTAEYNGITLTNNVTVNKA